MKKSIKKSPEFIQKKYIQLLEESHETLQKKNVSLALKSFIFLFGFLSISLFFYYQNYAKNTNICVFQNHLEKATFNSENVFVETENGDFYKINPKTNKKWVTKNGLFVHVTNKSIKFESTKNNTNIFKPFTIHTPKDKKFVLILEDGTKIKLNTNTKITRNYKKDIDLILQGEAFFKIAKQKNNNKIIIKANKMLVEVIGTEFNITNTIDKKFAKLSLLEGSVKIKNNNKFTFIKPGEQVTVFNNNNLLVEEADFNLALAWTKDRLSFRDKTLLDITKTIALWYDVNFVFKNKKIKKIHFTGALDREAGLTHFLEILKYTLGVHYKINNKTIYLFP